MYKGVVLSLCSLFSAAMVAEDFNPEEAKKAKIITYTLTVYHDETEYNSEKWDAVIQDALNAVTQGKRSEGTTSDAADTIAACMNTLKKMSQRGKGDGIHGELTIALSDGMPDANRCGSGCPCLSKYGGLCPCSEEKRCCQETGTSSCLAACSRE